MLFPFLQYLSPTWYFNLPPGGKHPYFPDYDKLTEQEKALLDFDFTPSPSYPLTLSTSQPLSSRLRQDSGGQVSTSSKKGYSSRDVSKLDAAYQAWHKGFILEDPKAALNLGQIKPSVSDNYRFIRRYFHPLWSWYVLILRLITLHNPVREIAGFLRQARVKRLNLYDKIYPHAVEEMFNVQPLNSRLRQGSGGQVSTSQPLNLSTSNPLNLPTSQPPNLSTSQPLNLSTSNLLNLSPSTPPKVSVIIPTLNRYPYLKDALHDLEQQDYKNFEVIVVDQSEPFQPEFYEQFQLDLKVIRQEEKALWLARNTAIKMAKGEYIAMYEDDVRVSEKWLSHHLKCLDYFEADISAGVFFPAGGIIPSGRSFFRWADQFATGNACLKKEVFQKIGLFDRQFERQRMGDGEFGLRAYLAGLKSISNPYAFCEDVKAASGGLRQMGSWDAFRPKSWLEPRPVPSVLYLYRKYFGTRLTLLKSIPDLIASSTPYVLKRSTPAIVAGMFLSFFLLPVLAVQFYRSWRLASDKLQTGDQIEQLQAAY